MLRRPALRLVPERQRLAWLEQTILAPRSADRTERVKLFCTLGGGEVRLIRRARARGSLHASDAPAIPVARTEADRILMALKATREGAATAALRDGLLAFDRRTYETSNGHRAPAAAVAHATCVERFDLHEPDFGPSVDQVRRAGELSASLADQSGISAERTVLRLAMLGGPSMLSRFTGWREAAGRRGDHALLAALGVIGDPSALDSLSAALGARDVDPARGFAQRRISADGIGELGMVSGVRKLVHALAAERDDFEGRPGAGLGIQYPVRANILRALGEIGDISAVRVLLPYLADNSGSAFGGFYLPAMDALVKLGPAVAPAVTAWRQSANPGGRVHAEGVLEALQRVD